MTADVTPSPTVPPQEAPSVLHMYRALVGVGVLCGLLIVSVYEATKPVIQAKRAAALREAVFTVVPGADSSRAFRPTDAGGFAAVENPDAVEGTVLYAGYDATGRLIGVALPASGMGYADVIRVLYGYAFEEDAIVGMKVLTSKETPGLGDKIETDETFRQNFERLDASLAPDGESLAHPITYVSSGEKEAPWQVDGITGATISSKAIATMLGESAKRWVPLLEASQADFQQQGENGE